MRNRNTTFLMLGWDHYGLDKKCTGTPYAELLFLHPIGFKGHIAHSGVSGARNGNTLFSFSGATGTDSIKNVLGHVTLNLCFCIRWDLRVT
jgi:hypothetical protein